MNAAIYCRVSTEDQEREGSSLQSQRDYCLHKAHDLGYDVPEEYIFSEVFSGADTDRPKLIELRRLVKSHSVGSVVCYSTDRLARNPIHIAIIAEECEKRGIELVFVSEPLDKTPEGALIRYIKGYAAQIEREKIRGRSIRGKREKARQSKLSTGGPRLFGYDVVQGRRVVNDTEAEVIRRIFNWFAEGGYTLYEAVRQLNQERIPGPAGGKWNENTVYRMLTHPAYFGVTYAFRYKCVEPKRTKVALRTKRKSARKLRDMSEWIEIPGAIPAIVSKEVYDAARKQLSINRHKSPVNRKHHYLFTGGRLRCGTCGRSMTGSVKKKNGKPWLYYRCVCNVKSNYYEKCLQPSISANRVESAVWSNLMDMLNHPDVLVENIRSKQSQVPAVIEAEEYLIKRNIQKAREEEKRYLQLYGKGRINEDTFESVAEKVKDTIQLNERKLKDLRIKRESMERVEANADKLIESAHIFSKVLNKADYPLQLKALDIQVTYTPDKNIVIDGLLPVGVTDFDMSWPWW